jgi:hypothetical protein
VYRIPSLVAKAIATDYTDSIGIGKALQKTKNQYEKNASNRKILDFTNNHRVGLLECSTFCFFFEETTKLTL